jgi:hypothetical protein
MEPKVVFAKYFPLYLLTLGSRQEGNGWISTAAAVALDGEDIMKTDGRWTRNKKESDTWAVIRLLAKLDRPSL